MMNLPGMVRIHKNPTRIIFEYHFFPAQIWANQCPASTWVQSNAPPHDPNRKSTKFGNKSIGQNMATSWSSKKNKKWGLKQKVQSWYDEVTKYQFDNSTVGAFDSSASLSDPQGPIGHYTQVVWAETEYVGCGVVYWKDPNPNYAQYPWRKVIILPIRLEMG